MIPSVPLMLGDLGPVYQRGWMIDSQPFGTNEGTPYSISKGMDD